MSDPTLLNESERLTLEVVLAVFEVIFASAGAFISWRSGRNPVVWFFIGLIPIIGMFAVLFFIEMPLRNSGAVTATGGQPAASGRKAMSAQERRVAFGLICWLVLFHPLMLVKVQRTRDHLAFCGSESSTYWVV